MDHDFIFNVFHDIGLTRKFLNQKGKERETFHGPPLCFLAYWFFWLSRSMVSSLTYSSKSPGWQSSRAHNCPTFSKEIIL